MTARMVGKPLPKSRDYPLTIKEIHAMADRLDTEARAKTRQANQLRVMAGRIGCRCSGAITIPWKKDGSRNVDAAYVNHDMWCRYV